MSVDALDCNLLSKSIKLFFDDKLAHDKLLSIYKCKRLQPRLIDFFVTQMAKDEPQFFMLTVQGETWGLCDVYTSYKNQLKAYHKKNFNLFEKKKTIIVQDITSPISKLNVYKWLIQNDIYTIIYNNLHTIQKKYYEYRKHCCLKKKIKKRGKMKTFINHPIIIKINDLRYKKNN